MKTSGFFRYAAAAAAVFLLTLLMAVPAAAEEGVIDLGYSEKYSRTYTKYDVDGDGSPDKISIGLGEKQEEGSYNKLIIRINGKAAFTKRYAYEGTFGAKVRLITLKNGKVYLYLEDSMGDYHTLCALFRYNGTKLVKAFDFKKLNGLFPADKLEHVHGDPERVSGNTISFMERFQCGALAYTSVAMKIVYKSGKLQLSSRYLKMNGINGSEGGKYYKLVTGISAYPTATASKVARNFKKGTLLRISQLVIGQNGDIRFRATSSSGRYGYISVHRQAKNEEGIHTPLFEGLDYAG